MGSPKPTRCGRSFRRLYPCVIEVDRRRAFSALRPACCRTRRVRPDHRALRGGGAAVVAFLLPATDEGEDEPEAAESNPERHQVDGLKTTAVGRNAQRRGSVLFHVVGSDGIDARARLSLERISLRVASAVLHVQVDNGKRAQSPHMHSKLPKSACSVGSVISTDPA